VGSLRQLYLIVRYGSKGLGLSYILSDPGQEILPVFSSEEAAQNSPWQRQTERSKA